MKTFNTKIDYENTAVEEIHLLLAIESRIRDVENEIMRRQENASRN